MHGQKPELSLLTLLFLPSAVALECFLLGCFFIILLVLVTVNCVGFCRICLEFSRRLEVLLRRRQLFSQDEMQDPQQRLQSRVAGHYQRTPPKSCQKEATNRLTVFRGMRHLAYGLGSCAVGEA